VQSGGDGVGDMRQQVRWRGDDVASDNGGGCAAKGGRGGVLQKGAWGGGSAHGGGVRVQGHG
jgi:hypothetical protein